MAVVNVDKLYWYTSKNNPPYDKFTGEYYGYYEQPSVGFIEKYDLRDEFVETWDKMCDRYF